jgi:hypothetical protein
MLKWIGSFFGKLFALAGALIMSQAPLFIQYYTQQLAGRVAELEWQMQSMREVATLSGKNLDEYVQKFLISTDQDFKLQGQFMAGVINRWHEFTESLHALQHATVWTKPFIFLQKMDWSIAHSTYESYKVGLTLNLEGLMFTLAGLILGYLVFLVVQQILILTASPFKRLFGSRKKNEILKQNPNNKQ